MIIFDFFPKGILVALSLPLLAACSGKAAIHQHATQLGQQALKANHGKLPDCLSAQ
jgi:hypothetical protein